MQNKVQQTIKRYNMLKPGDRVLVGVSGGPDSIALLHVLYYLKTIWNLELMVAHFNHLLRKEAALEASFVSAFAENLGLSARIGEGDVARHARESGLSTQAAARELRYQFLEKAASETKSQKIALAHQLDDQAETILMHFLRGPSPRGLAGIPPVRANIVRPLIEVSRKEVEDYVKRHGLDTVFDSSNHEKIYLRNRLRLELMPILEEYNPNLVTRLARAAEIFRAEDHYLRGEAERSLTKLVVKDGDGRLSLNYSEYHKLPLAIKRRLLRRCYLEFVPTSRDLGFEQVERILTWLEVPEKGRSFQWSSGLKCSLQGNYIVMEKTKGEAESADYVFRLQTPGSVETPGGRLTVGLLPGKIPSKAVMKDYNRWEALIDRDKVNFPLTIRNRRSGDRFYPLGVGGSKKLKDFFIDLKIPWELRSQIPIVVSADGQIIWIAGLRLDDRFKVTEGTENALYLSYAYN